MQIKIQSIIRNKVFINGSWLYLLQFFNTIIPLLTLPYITRVLGSSEYGVFSFSLNIVTYFQVLVEYGFNLTGARKLALTNDIKEQSKIYSSITVTKILLCIASFISMIIITLSLGLEQKYINTTIILYIIVIGTAIQQNWLFHGLQKMKFITLINVIARSISVILIFLLVKNSNDIYLYCALYAITSLVSGMLSIFLVRYKLQIKLRKVRLKDILSEMKAGWYTFTTSAMSKVLSGIGITVLGIAHYSDSIVGVYSAIQKVPLLVIMLFAPVSQAIFPYISQRFEDSYESGRGTVLKVSRLIMPLVGGISTLLILFSEQIVDMFFGNEYSDFSSLLIPLSCWVFFSILNNFLGVQSLIASGYLKEYSKAFNISIIFLIILNITFGPLWGMFGVASATLISEIILTLGILYQINKINRIRINMVNR
ncbi:flippase [Bacillus sp. D386]|uniref:flippase n=1 Tax=Bacillus sp. D386 TaxID=2587155 RepID=UPI00111E05BD|nr:flippase [Bacillus sp. D386]